MRKLVAPAVILMAVLGLAGVSQAQLVLYDDFNVKPINPARWYGGERHFGPAAPNTEATRKLARGKLEIDLTTWGRTDSDTGTPGNAHVSLYHGNPAGITTVQADVTVKSVKVTGCAANSTPTRARARLLGYFFNDGTRPGPGDQTGDILASIQKTRDTITGDVIGALVARCTDASCWTATTLAVHTFATGWTRGVPDTLRIQWDPANDRFIFTVDPGGVNETITLGYTVSDATPPTFNGKYLSAANSPASCLSGPRTSATMKALFDNVMVNP